MISGGVEAMIVILLFQVAMMRILPGRRPWNSSLITITHHLRVMLIMTVVSVGGGILVIMVMFGRVIIIQGEIIVTSYHHFASHRMMMMDMLLRYC